MSSINYKTDGTADKRMQLATTLHRLPIAVRKRKYRKSATNDKTFRTRD